MVCSQRQRPVPEDRFGGRHRGCRESRDRRQCGLCGPDAVEEDEHGAGLFKVSVLVILVLYIKKRN